MGITDEIRKAVVGSQEQAHKDTEALIAILKEIRDNQVGQNDNWHWVMEAIQELCNKTGVTLKDPLEIEEVKQ